jgi:hypothetical protein
LIIRIEERVSRREKRRRGKVDKEDLPKETHQELSRERRGGKKRTQEEKVEDLKASDPTKKARQVVDSYHRP